MKRFAKFLVLILSLICFSGFSAPTFAASFSLSVSKNQVAPGEKFTISVGGSCTGYVKLTSSGGALSASDVWVEENYTSVSVTAGKSGTVTITATPQGVLSDSDGNEYNPGPRSTTVKIVAPAPATPKPTTTTTDEAKPKEETTKPEDDATSEDADKNSSTNAGANVDENSAAEKPTEPKSNSNNLPWALAGFFATLFVATAVFAGVIFTKYQKLLQQIAAEKSTKTPARRMKKT